MLDAVQDRSFTIQGHSIRNHGRPFIIAEVAQAHDGSLGFAHSYIDVAAEAGVDAVKFQTHIAEAESTIDETFRVNFSIQDATRYDYWKRMEFSFPQWQELSLHAEKKGLVFLSSCFSVQAVEWMRKLSIPAWKIGSGEIGTPDLFEAITQGTEPILLSTGLSDFDNIADALGKIRKHANPVGLFQCTTAYPNALSTVGLNVIDEIAEKFKVPAGLSDHSGSIWPGIAAMARGAAMIEIHIALHENQFGPDTRASLVPSELRKLVEARDAIDEMLRNSVDKSQMTNDQREMRQLFGKSLALRQPLTAGTVLQEHHLTWKKPGTGLGKEEYSKLVGNRLKQNVSANRLLRLDDLE